jgi:Flp pilus assembly protein TadG
MRRRLADRLDDRGVVSTYVAILATALLFVTGLVVDGGGKIATYIEASNLASSAARAGAQAVDQAELYDTGDVVIDPAEAEELANAYLAAADHPGTGVVEVDGNTVTVTVTLTHVPKMLPIGSQAITADESATALRGVETGS